MDIDVIYYNGDILTVNAADEVKEAVAIKGNKIVAVGTKDEILSRKNENTKLVDLEGKCVVPGFIDSHQHIGMQAFNAISIDCRYPNVKSIDDILRKIEEVRKDVPKGAWIRGWGYNENFLDEKRHPERFDLDKVAPDNPVFLIRVCGHVSTNNSCALKMAGIEDSTPSPAGGEIVHNEKGECTGVVKEKAHNMLLKIALPTEAELLKGMEIVSNKLTKEGITSVHEAGAYGALLMKTLQRGTERDIVKQRVYSILFSFIDNEDFVYNYIDSGISTGFGSEKFKIGPIKLMVDGSSSAPTASVIDEYCSDKGNHGILCYSPDEVDQVLLDAHKAGFQVTCHAVGDNAVTVVVDAIEKALLQYPRENHRHRIEHCALVNDSLISRIKKLNITPIAQPVFFYEFGDGYIKNYGEDRVNQMFTCKSWFDNQVITAGSSDCPVTNSDPLFGIYIAMNRITQTSQRISQSERVNVKQALRMYTINGAYASFEEEIKGSIEPNKLADLVILSESPYNVSPDKIADIKVEATMIDGKIVYENK